MVPSESMHKCTDSSCGNAISGEEVYLLGMLDDEVMTAVKAARQGETATKLQGKAGNSSTSPLAFI
jgi:hypothetical protein